MIFTPTDAKLIARGVKTQHRTPVLVRRSKIGHDYAVTPGRCRIRVLDRRRVLLGAITYRDAKAEGHRTTDAFRVAWVRRHDRAWLARQKVDLLTATLDDDEIAAIVHAGLLARFAVRWAPCNAWVITFELLTDGPLYLARQRDILAGGEQYTPIRARSIDELEAACGPWLDREAKQRAEHGERMRATFRRDLEEERARRATAGLSNRALRHINRADDRAA